MTVVVSQLEELASEIKVNIWTYMMIIGWKTRCYIGLMIIYILNCIYKSFQYLIDHVTLAQILMINLLIVINISAQSVSAFSNRYRSSISLTHDFCCMLL